MPFDYKLQQDFATLRLSSSRNATPVFPSQRSEFRNSLSQRSVSRNARYLATLGNSQRTVSPNAPSIATRSISQHSVFLSLCVHSHNLYICLENVMAAVEEQEKNKGTKITRSYRQALGVRRIKMMSVIESEQANWKRTEMGL